MSDYQLYYWPIPFRGQFIRALLAHAGQTWDEVDSSEISRMMKADPAKQPVPFTGPPVLVDPSANLVLSQMPAIAWYLGQKLGLLPESPADRAMTLKIVNDANDVIDDLTNDGGREMWTPQKWHEYQPRLKHWMAMFEATGTRHGLTPTAGWMLGGAQAGVADIVTATLWGTIAEKFPTIGELFDKTAPATAGLTKRLRETPALAALTANSAKLFGDVYCGGEIEKSLRKSMG